MKLSEPSHEKLGKWRWKMQVEGEDGRWKVKIEDEDGKMGDGR